MNTTEREERERLEQETVGYLAQNAFLLRGEQRNPGYDRYTHRSGAIVCLYDDGRWSFHKEDGSLLLINGDTLDELKECIERWRKATGAGERQPQSRASFRNELESFCRRIYADNPVVEVQKIDTGTFRVRVGQNSSMPRYFRVKVTEEQS